MAADDLADYFRAGIWKAFLGRAEFVIWSVRRTPHFMQVERRPWSARIHLESASPEVLPGTFNDAQVAALSDLGWYIDPDEFPNPRQVFWPWQIGAAAKVLAETARRVWGVRSPQEIACDEDDDGDGSREAA